MRFRTTLPATRDRSEAIVHNHPTWRWGMHGEGSQQQKTRLALRLAGFEASCDGLILTIGAMVTTKRLAVRHVYSGILFFNGDGYRQIYRHDGYAWIRRRETVIFRFPYPGLRRIFDAACLVDARLTFGLPCLMPCPDPRIYRCSEDRASTWSAGKAGSAPGSAYDSPSISEHCRADDDPFYRSTQSATDWSVPLEV